MTQHPLLRPVPSSIICCLLEKGRIRGCFLLNLLVGEVQVHISGYRGVGILSEL